MLDQPSETLSRFIETHCAQARTSSERAYSLYYAVRDQINYEIFNVAIDEASLNPARIIESGRGFCLHKAILFASACREAGICSRLLASKVRNHVSSPAISTLVAGDVFLHWYAEIMIEGVWLKVSPTFNRNLCKLYGFQPLDFDGSSDAINHDNGDGRTMEYLGVPYVFDAPKHGEIIQLIAAHHPNMVNSSLTVLPNRTISPQLPATSPGPDAPKQG